MADMDVERITDSPPIDDIDLPDDLEFLSSAKIATPSTPLSILSSSPEKPNSNSLPKVGEGNNQAERNLCPENSVPVPVAANERKDDSLQNMEEKSKLKPNSSSGESVSVPVPVPAQAVGKRVILDKQAFELPPYPKNFIGWINGQDQNYYVRDEEGWSRGCRRFDIRKLSVKIDRSPSLDLKAKSLPKPVPKPLVNGQAKHISRPMSVSMGMQTQTFQSSENRFPSTMKSYTVNKHVPSQIGPPQVAWGPMTLNSYQSSSSMFLPSGVRFPTWTPPAPQPVAVLPQQLQLQLQPQPQPQYSSHFKKWKPNAELKVLLRDCFKDFPEELRNKLLESNISVRYYPDNRMLTPDGSIDRRVYVQYSGKEHTYFNALWMGEFPCNKVRTKKDFDQLNASFLYPHAELLVSERHVYLPDTTEQQPDFGALFQQAQQQWEQGIFPQQRMPTAYGAPGPSGTAIIRPSFNAQLPRLPPPPNVRPQVPRYMFNSRPGGPRQLGPMNVNRNPASDLMAPFVMPPMTLGIPPPRPQFRQGPPPRQQVMPPRAQAPRPRAPRMLQPRPATPYKPMPIQGPALAPPGYRPRPRQPSQQTVVLSYTGQEWRSVPPGGPGSGPNPRPGIRPSNVPSPRAPSLPRVQNGEQVRGKVTIQPVYRNVAGPSAPRFPPRPRMPGPALSAPLGTSYNPQPVRPQARLDRPQISQPKAVARNPVPKPKMVIEKVECESAFQGDDMEDDPLNSGPSVPDVICVD